MMLSRNFFGIWMSCTIVIFGAETAPTENFKQSRLRCMYSNQCPDSGSVCMFLTGMPIEQFLQDFDYETDLSALGPTRISDEPTDDGTTQSDPPNGTTDPAEITETLTTTFATDASDDDYIIEAAMCAVEDSEVGNSTEPAVDVQVEAVTPSETTSTVVSQVGNVGAQNETEPGIDLGRPKPEVSSAPMPRGICVCDEKQRFACNTDAECAQRFGLNGIKCIPTSVCPSSVKRAGYCRKPVTLLA